MADESAKFMTIQKIAAGDNAAGFPKEVLAPIWKRAFEGSLVQQIAGTTPVSLAGNAMPYPTGRPVAGIVGEAGEKPVTEVSVGIKTFTPKKAAAIVVLSKEALMANPLGAFDDLQQQLSQAIADTIDTAVLFGKDTKTGTALTGVESVNDTPHVVTLDPAQEAAAGYIGKQVSAAYDKVVLQSDVAGDYDVNQFIFSPAMRSKVVNASDTLGRPLYQGSLNLKDPMSTVFGVPTIYSKTINGRGVVTEPKILGFGGDFRDNLRLGFVENLTWATADQYAAGKDLFTYNLVAIRVEAIFGWVLRDKKAFVKIAAK